MTQHKNILLFIGNDHIVNAFLNQTIHHLLDMGLNPILISVKPHSNTAEQFAEMQRYKFYETEILNKHIYRYLEQSNCNQFISKSLNQLIQKYDLDFIETKNVNNGDFIKKISDLDFIGAISIRCFQIFKQEIINTVKTKGFFCNSHPGILPDYRGVYCLLRGLVNGDKKLGWTLHEIDYGIDTGKIIKEIPFYDFGKEPMINIMARTVPFLANGWLNFLDNYKNGGTIAAQRQENLGNYYTYPVEQEMTAWIRNGSLEKICAKKMVQFYFDMFVAKEDKLKPFAQDFKVFLINKISQFETILEMEFQEKTEVYEPQHQAA
jgi:methionyl-tRNA formyltransferase